MSETLYLVTGAAGFLGSHVCHQLLERGEKVRAFVLDGDPAIKYIPKEAEIVKGDLCDIDSLENFFKAPEGTETIVLHVASMVSVNPDFNQKLVDVNVGGTKNIIQICQSLQIDIHDRYICTHADCDLAGIGSNRTCAEDNNLCLRSSRNTT